MTLRNFEPTINWSDKDGLLTERARGYLRGLWDYIGAATGILPPSTLGAPGNTTTFYRGDGTFAVPNYPDPTATTGTAAPLTGTYATGSFVRNLAPVEAGSVPETSVIYGWLCITGGTPGTWETLYVPTDTTGPTTALIATSGTTYTLPAASSNQGREVTVILGTNGWVDIACAGADEVAVDGGQTTIRLDAYGASITLRAVAATTWGIV